jgi:hypothetical protein
VDRQPDLGSKSIKTLTDGVIEGFYTDGLSAGWIFGKEKVCKLTFEGDLGASAQCSRLSIRTGGLKPDYCPDHAVLYCGLKKEEMKKIADIELIAKDGANWIEFEKQSMRYIKIELVRSKQADAPVYVGEIQLIGL